MAFDCEVGSFTLNTSTGNQTITLADSGITPKIVWMRCTRSTSNGNYQDHAFFSLGWGDLTTEFSCQSGSEDNVGTSVVTRSIQDNILTAFDPSAQQAVSSVSAANPTVITVTNHGYSNSDKVAVRALGSTPAVDGVFTISSVTTDTFTVPVNVTGEDLSATGRALKITEQATLVSFSAGSFVISVDVAGSAITVEYMVWGGSDLENVFVGNFNAPTATGNFSVTGTGFEPTAVFMMTSQNSNAANSPPFMKLNNVESVFSFGFMGLVGQNSTQCTDCIMNSEDQVTTMETNSIAGLNTECLDVFAFKSGAWALDGSFTFSSMDSDGFTCREGGATPPAVAYYVGYLAVRGSNWEAVQKTSPASTGTQAIVNSGGFTPDGAMFTLGNDNDAAMMHGWASNDGGSKPFPEGVGHMSDDDAITTSDAKRLTRLDKCLTTAFAGSSTDRAVADLHTWDPSGLTVDFTTAGGGFQFTFHAIMFGDAGTPFEGGTGTDEGLISLV